MGGYANPGANVTGGSYFTNGVAPTNSQNQYFGSMPGMANPGTTSSPGGSSAYPFASPTAISGYNTGTAGGQQTGNVNATGQNYSVNGQGGGLNLINLQYPGLSSNFANMLNSQIGQGLPGFNQSTQLPGGGTTQPGQLSAPLNSVLQQLMQMYNGQGSNVPGGNVMNQIANQGISALPEWQSMLQAMQQNIGQQQSNLQGQFASMGDLAGSGFGNAMQNFQQGTTATQNALLAQLTQQNIGTQIGVGENLEAGANQFGSGLQALQNQAIQQQYQQFQTDLPQNNPLLSLMSQYGSMYPPAAGSQSGAQQAGEVMSGIGNMIGGGGYNQNSGQITF